MKVRHYLNGVEEKVEEREEEEEERILIKVIEDYDVNNNFYSRVTVGVSSSSPEEIFKEIERVLFDKREVREEWDILQGVFNVFYEHFGADPTYECFSKYVGGDFPRREITIKFY